MNTTVWDTKETLEAMCHRRRKIVKNICQLLQYSGGETPPVFLPLNDLLCTNYCRTYNV